MEIRYHHVSVLAARRPCCDLRKHTSKQYESVIKNVTFAFLIKE